MNNYLWIFMRTLILFFLTASFSSLFALDVKVDMGTGLFYSGAKGRIDYLEKSFQGSNAVTDISSATNFYIWGDFETSNPYLPKLRLEYLKISAEGGSQAHLESSVDAIKELIKKLEPLGLNDKNWNSQLQHNIYDIDLYYEFFEKSDWPSIGLGLGYKYFDYIYIMDIDLVPGLQFGDRDSSGAPMLFFSSRYDVPSIQMGFEADAKVYLFGDSDMYDWKVKIDLMFELDQNTALGAEFGYRQQYFNLTGSDVEKVTGNMTYEGIFVGAVLKFK